ncbi:DUF305 domain-containing protein [Hoyosella sp. YIM 151337]|uniref:DUF305 domain-containing protein n=1 Tax=Hoyosella sp. YIM 151337 TaxID=2992742 RepID=UPI002236006C|nr:DUF305 domain-containing protein [Hoyosella sp. YIM 151337]MCW4351967.1 DUF305 domain-containing protein [Hoyosella sp. YIM 151337]
MKRTVAAAAAAVAVLIGTAACGDDGAVDPDTTAAPPAAEDVVTGEVSPTDVWFAQMMIPHHDQAIEMSDMLLAKDGIDDRVLALAEDIKAAQTPEVEQLSEWLSAWGEDVPPTGMPMQPGNGMRMPGHEMAADDMHAGPGGMGMMSAEDMQALADAEGDDAARLFLEHMIVHHEGAVMMAQREVDEGTHPGATEMANTIIETQQQEITEMRQLLDEL